MFMAWFNYLEKCKKFQRNIPSIDRSYTWSINNAFIKYNC